LMSLLSNGVEEVSFLRLLSLHCWDAKICWLRMWFLCLYLLDLDTWLLFFM
jgi:hypothetical protein